MCDFVYKRMYDKARLIAEIEHELEELCDEYVITEPNMHAKALNLLHRRGDNRARLVLENKVSAAQERKQAILKPQVNSIVRQLQEVES